MMSPTPSEKSVFSLYITDFDYIAVRNLMRSGLFSSAGALANITIDRYIKTYLWSIGRDDLVQVIKKWGGNESHNIVRMIEFCKTELGISPTLDEGEVKILTDIYTTYRFRYIDEMYKSKDQARVMDNYIYTIDKVCYFFRGKIVLIPPQLGKTIIDLLIEGRPESLVALNHGNVDLREVLLHDNKYFRANN